MTDSLLGAALAQADKAVAMAAERLGLPSAALPPCRPRRQGTAIASAAAFPLAALTGDEPRALAVRLAPALELTDTWLGRAEAREGYINLIPASGWYRAVMEEILTGAQDIPAVAGLVLPGQDGPTPESRENPVYNLWYARRRAALKAAEQAEAPALGAREEQALFLLAALPREARRRDPDRLCRYLADVAGLFFSYEQHVRRGEASRGLYPCFDRTLDRGLGALGIRWSPKNPWGDREMETII